MRIGLVGCGFVADLYMSSLALHPGIEVSGAFDVDAKRLSTFTQAHRIASFASLESLLGDERIEVVVNLTAPQAHFEVSRAALLAGKHVYSEKPLATELSEAKQLVQLAAQRGLLLAGAPCTLLGETAQTLWRAVRQGQCGNVRLVYAELDEGLLSRAPFTAWKSPTGAPWPFRSEFETGCTLEHAGYCLTWLAAMFGPAQEVTSFSALLDDRKHPSLERSQLAPDFSVACLRFGGGVVARLTNSIVAPHDHRFLVVGDEAILYTKESWSIRAPVYRRKWRRIRRRLFLDPFGLRCRLADSGLPRPRSGGSQVIDFARGLEDLAESLRTGAPCRLGADFALHVTELALAIQNAHLQPQPYRLTSTFAPVRPMDWAR
jgi:predicted dehydrogenase